MTVPAVADQNKGWWVIVGAYSRDGDKQTIGVRHVERLARPCGLQVFNDFSGKFVGFQGDHMAFVSRGRPFQTRQDALAEQKRIKRCFPDAYVKHATYLGE